MPRSRLFAILVKFPFSSINETNPDDVVLEISTINSNLEIPVHTDCSIHDSFTSPSIFTEDPVNFGNDKYSLHP